MPHTILPDADVHPTTLATLTMLRDLILADESAAALLLLHNVDSVKAEVDQIPNIVVVSVGPLRYLGTLGIINATLRCANADVIGAQTTTGGRIAGLVGVRETRPATTG